jgi:PAS domain S-box-containing protein
MTRRNSNELQELRDRLREAEETLAAIRNGEVDSLVVSGPQGDQVFSLRTAEQPYRVFVEQMLEGAVTLSADGTVLYCNRRFAEMMRSRMETIIGAPIQTFVQGSDLPELEQILKHPSPQKVRYILLAADGAPISAQLAFSCLPIEQEQLQAVCVVVTDLTEQEERRELAIALQNLRLAQEQLQRQNDELARARSAAEAANEAKDHFLAALSHELRTPLTPVLMTVASLEEDRALPDSARRELALLRRNVELEARLIDDLLDITGIARGKMEIKTDIVEVHGVLAIALDICRSEIGSKNLRVREILEAHESHVQGDAVRIQQILWNLIRNAVKFTPSGGQIIIRSTNEADRLRISVEDTGIDIAMDAMEKIFSPFEQADRFITRRFGGLGLGLTISKRLAELHNGTLTAHSDGRGKGARFTVTLPVVAAPSAKGPRGASENGDGDATTMRPLKILLVEDHEDTRRSMARLLGARHMVRDVDTVAGALHAAGAEPFDLVISDLGLPDGSGLDLMRQLRQRYGLKGICLSGYGMEDDVARSADAGFCRHLTKPIDLRKLENIIRSIED